MNGLLLRASGTEAVRCKIGAPTDAHASVANQKEDIRAQVVAAEKLPLQQLILFSGKRTRKSVGKARDVLASDKVGEFRKLVCPRQFVKGPAQGDQQVGVRGGRQWSVWERR